MGLLKVSEQYDSQPILPLEVLALQAPFPGGALWMDLGAPGLSDAQPCSASSGWDR